MTIERPTENNEGKFAEQRKALFERVNDEKRRETPQKEVQLFLDVLKLLNEDAATDWNPLHELKIDAPGTRRRNFRTTLWDNCDIQLNWLKQKTPTKKVDRISVDICQDNEIIMALKLERGKDGELKHFTTSLIGPTTDFDTTEAKVLSNGVPHRELQKEMKRVLDRLEDYWKERE